MSGQNRSQNMMRYAGLGTQWMVLMLIAVWGGHKLDVKVGLQFPVFLLVFVLGALAFSFWQLIKELNVTKK